MKESSCPARGIHCNGRVTMKVEPYSPSDLLQWLFESVGQNPANFNGAMKESSCPERGNHCNGRVTMEVRSYSPSDPLQWLFQIEGLQWQALCDCPPPLIWLRKMLTYILVLIAWCFGSPHELTYWRCVPVTFERRENERETTEAKDPIKMDKWGLERQKRVRYNGLELKKLLQSARQTLFCTRPTLQAIIAIPLHGLLCLRWWIEGKPQ